MFCTNCGRQNEEGSIYCEYCGKTLSPTVKPAAQGNPYPPPYAQTSASPYAPYPHTPQAQAVPAKKKRKGLVAGLITGGVVVAAAVIIIASLSKGSPVLGNWYSEERGVVLEFKDGGIVVSRTKAGRDEGSYTYDSGSDKGTIKADGETYEFSLEDKKIEIDDVGMFVQADSDFDVSEFLYDD